MAAALASSYVGDTIVVPPIQTLAYSSELDASIRAGKRVGGSTNARQIDFGGQKYIYKAGPVENVVNEFVAFLLFAAAGGNVPHVTLVYNELADNIPMGILIEYIKGKTVAESLRSGGTMTAIQRNSMFSALQHDMVLHALFANWDAKNSENHMIREADGWASPVAIDLGGALFYRAMGEPKADREFMSGSVSELVSIPHNSSETTSKLYAPLTNLDYLKEVVCSRWSSVSVASILSTIDALHLFLRYLPRGEELQRIIASRCDYIQRFCDGEIAVDDGVTTAANRVAVERSLMKEITRPLMRRRTMSTKEYNLRPNNIVVYPRSESASSSTALDMNTLLSENIVPTSLYPEPAFTLRGGRETDILATNIDPVLLAWMKQHTYILKHTLSPREQDIIRSYTRQGDVLVNNYLRGILQEDIKDLIVASLEDADDLKRPIPLAYAIYDQLPRLVREKRVNAPSKNRNDLLVAGSESQVNMTAMAELIRKNLAFFRRRVNILELLEQYARDLKAIIVKMPRPPRKFTVFRGIHDESYLQGLTFQNKDFFSTTSSATTAITDFTKSFSNSRTLYNTVTYHCCIYELEVSPTVPCIYLQGISEFKNEFEVLFAPGALIHLGDTVTVKYHLRDATDVHLLKTKGKRVSVVEGTITMPRVMNISRPTVSSERFAAQKPRSMKRRNSRRWVPEWKLQRNLLTRKRR